MKNPALELGRRLSREEAWEQAYETLTEVDGLASLKASDLELLASAAYMIGRDADYVACLERAHHGFLDLGDTPRAVRCGFWIGHSFLFRGERARSAGWFARAQRLLDGIDHDCIERGYLQIPVWLAEMGRGDFEGGYATAVQAAEIGERFDDADLVWLARDEQAPYCNTIAFCLARYEIRHVREWFEALTQWCSRQPEMVAHDGLCLVHRAQIMLLEGRWQAAQDEACRSAERFSAGALNQLACGEAFYCQGEVHRLRGQFERAEEAYRLAGQHGRQPQPGLALMRLTQNKADAAAAMIRRVVGETTVQLARARMLPAYVDIMLALGSLDPARTASRELNEISARFGCEVLEAMASHSSAAVELADGSAVTALIILRRAIQIWTELSAPYEVGRVQMRVALACRALGDAHTAAFELEAARRTFEKLGAAPDLRRAELLIEGATPMRQHGLTGRELEVLRGVAGGKTNREISTELFISEHTVARHVQNIFAKLDVSSRTAATAFAFEHDLV